MAEELYDVLTRFHREVAALEQRVGQDQLVLRSEIDELKGRVAELNARITQLESQITHS